MKRLITLAVFLVATLAATPASAPPPVTGEWFCVALPVPDIGACVGNPFP